MKTYSVKGVISQQYFLRVASDGRVILRKKTMKYIETLEPLEPHFVTREYATPEEYFAVTKKIAPPFDPTRPIKMWELPFDSTPPRQVTFETLAFSEETGVLIRDPDGKYITELVVMLKSELPKVNIPPKDFNYIQFTNLRKTQRPLKANFTDEYDIVNTPDGFAMAARNKAKYAQYVVSQNAPASNPAFEATVISYLDAIAKKLGVI